MVSFLYLRGGQQVSPGTATQVFHANTFFHGFLSLIGCFLSVDLDASLTGNGRGGWELHFGVHIARFVVWAQLRAKNRQSLSVREELMPSVQLPFLDDRSEVIEVEGQPF